MTGTERTKMLRQERRAAGLCYQCGDRRPEPERALCGPCLDVNRQRAKAQRESALLRGKCPECGGPSTREEVRVAAQKRRRAATSSTGEAGPKPDEAPRDVHEIGPLV